MSVNRWFLFIVLSCIFANLTFAYDYGGESGTPEAPYKIRDANDLLVLAADTNDYNDCFILIDDINLAGYTFTTAVIAPDMDPSQGPHEAPAHFDSIPFSGVFDGNGHAITNLEIYSTVIDYDYLGLFGYISNAVVKNLGVEDCNIVSTTWLSYNLGGLVAESHGNIANCYVTGRLIYGETISPDIGGLVGGNYGTVSNCYADCDISCSGSGYESNRIGGLVGNNSGFIINCHAKGSIVAGYSSTFIGGLVGFNYNFISNCYATTYTYGNYAIGGLIGGNGGSVSASFWDINTSGKTTSAGGEGKTTAEMQDANTYTNAGWDFVTTSTNNTSGHWVIEQNNYPQLYFFDNSFLPYDFNGNGTVNNPYLIHDTNDLDAMWQNPGDFYKLVSEINMSRATLTTAVVPLLCSNFDGNGHSISNFTINGNTHLGLFGAIAPDCSVINVRTEDVNITGNNYVGGLCGQNLGGTLGNCYSTGTIAGTAYYTGGLCGENSNGTINNCYSKGSITGYKWTGGLCGLNYSATITNSYSTSSVIGRSTFAGGLCGASSYGDAFISNSYSTGSVTGNSSDGGFCGYSHGTISDCYFLDTAGADNGFGTPLTDSEMKDESNFIDWDFPFNDGDKDNWFMAFGGYPILTWQISPGDLYTDGRNNFKDFAVFSEFWMREDCSIYNYYCDFSDLDFDGDVDIDDLFELMSYWLETGIYD